MLSNLSFDRSRFILNRPYTLPIVIPQGCDDAVIFSLKTKTIYGSKIYLWNQRQASFMLNLLLLWDEINPIFEKIEKSKIYQSDMTEIYCLTMKRDFVRKFDNLVEAIAHARLLLELSVEKANKVRVSQMNFLTVYHYLEKIEVYDLLLSDH